MDTPTTTTTTKTTRGPTCFFNKNDGLVPQADNHNTLISRPLCLQRRSSLRNLSSSIMSSPRSSFGRRFCDTRFEDPQPHYLDACFFCKKTLGHNRDIFMYRGDIPFCSEDCRQEQIQMDEAKEKKMNLSASIKAMKEKDQRKSTSPNKTQNYPFTRDTVAAA